MEKIAQFYKVSEEQFINDWRAATGSSVEEAKSVYANIRLPRRATKGSAGYDFFAPESFTLTMMPNDTAEESPLSPVGAPMPARTPVGPVAHTQPPATSDPDTTDTPSLSPILPSTPPCN